MFHRIQQYPLVHYGGRTYRPRVYGGSQPDGSWGGWIVFFPLDGSPAVATDAETTQSTLQSLGVWAAGLTAVYLEGDLERALQLAAEPPVLAHLNEAEYAALEDAEILQTAADIERATANIDEAAAAAARADAERIREERLVTESALTAADAARRSREAQTESTRRTGSHRSSRKKR